MGYLHHDALVSIVFLLVILKWVFPIVVAGPTDGFTEQRYTTEIQKPYDVRVDERYSYNNGQHKFWVYSTDKPHFSGSSTSPRTEMALHGYDYSSGVWQFEGYAYVPSGTSGVSIMQIFGGSPLSTTLMLRVYDGSLRYYRVHEISPNIYNRWFRVNVIHNKGADNVKVFIDGELKYEASGRGGSSHYFKIGVYAQEDDSNYMESRWKGIRVLKK